MAILVKERTPLPGAISSRPSYARAESQTQLTEGVTPSLLAWLLRAGECVLGIVLTLLGLLTSVALVVSLIAAPFIAVSLTVFLFALAIWAAPVVIPVLLGLFLLALAVEVMGW